MSATTLFALAVAAAATTWALVLRTRLRRAREERNPGEGVGTDVDSSGERYRNELRHILDSVPDAFFLVDDEWRMTFFNEGALAMLERLGMTEEDVLGKRLWDVFPTPEDDPGRRMLERAMEEGAIESRESHYDPLGAWLEVRAFPSFEGLAVHVADATARKEAERRLRVSEERFRTIVENAPEAMVVVDPDREATVEVNENALELFGRSEEELRETMPFQLSPEHQPDGRRSVDAAREYLARALEGERPSFEWVHLSSDGTKLHTEVRLARIPSEHGRLVQANIRDVTDRKRAENALRESEERFRTLFEQDVAGNFVTTVDGRILACNRAFARIFGFDSVDDAVGSDSHQLHASEEQRARLLRRLRRDGEVDFFEFEGRTVDGRRLHLVESVRGIFDDDGRLEELRGHVLDVTEKKTLEEQLQQAQRLEAVGRLAGGIAHDFNNLLTTVTGHADLLLTDERLEGPLREDVRRIKRASRRAARLTSQLMAFSRKKALKAVIVDINDVVRDVTEMLRRTIREDIRLDVRPGSDVRPVRADPGQLEQVLMNLVVNARDAMPRGGDLVISTRNVDVGEDDPERPPEVDPGRYAALEVRDTGGGIPAETMDKIFDPFYTTKGPGKGSGLGLAMVYGIARQSDGHVLVESEVGEGTSFTVLLPEASGKGHLLDSPDLDGLPATDGAHTILVIQHDPVVRKLVRRILHREGHSILEADDPDDAIAFCREWQGPVDAVVSDLLSSEHEARIRKALAEHRPEARILWTRESSTEAPPRTQSGEEILSKPFSSEELTRRVQLLLAGAAEDRRHGEESRETAGDRA